MAVLLVGVMLPSTKQNSYKELLVTTSGEEIFGLGGTNMLTPKSEVQSSKESS